MQSEAELTKQFTEEILALQKSGAGLPFVFTPAEAFQLLALLQLALRHPQVDGHIATFGKSLAGNIEERLCQTPALKEVARRGWEIS